MVRHATHRGVGLCGVREFLDDGCVNLRYGWPHGQFDGLGANLVMPRACRYPVSGAGDNRFGQLQDGIVGRGKAPVLGKPGQRGVLQVAAE